MSTLFVAPRSYCCDLNDDLPKHDPLPTLFVASQWNISLHGRKIMTRCPPFLLPTQSYMMCDLAEWSTKRVVNKKGGQSHPLGSRQ
jgi:hypothetical protein